jgi:hypothetical protein
MQLAPKIVASLAVIAATAAVATGAAASQGPTAQFESGQPAISAPKAPVLALPNIAPGAKAVRSVEVSNSGDAAGTFALNARTTGTGGLAEQLQVRAAVAGQIVYSGSLAGFRTASLGVVAPGGSATIRITLSLPAGSADLAGASVSTALAWTATQV